MMHIRGLLPDEHLRVLVLLVLLYL